MSEQLFYPQCDDVDMCEDDHCPNCGHCFFRQDCWNGCDDGYFDGYDDDPLWYDQGDMIRCDVCRGHGSLVWCPRCGWDNNVPAKWNTPEYRLRAITKYSPHEPTGKELEHL